MDALNGLLSAHHGAAWIEDGRTTTYAELREDIATRAALLELVPDNSVAAVVMSFGYSSIVDCFALWTRGVAVAPVTAQASDSESKIAGLAPFAIVSDGLVNPRERHRTLQGKLCATSLLLATSGSRGDPKWVALSAEGIVHNVRSIASYFVAANTESALPQRVALVLPLHYGYALVGQVLTTLGQGGTLIRANQTSFPDEQLQLMRQHSADTLSSVPTSLLRLAQCALAEKERPSLRLIGSAGGQLTREIAEQVRQAFPGASLFNQYGLTEASPRVSAVRHDAPAFALGSIGKPLRDIHARVVDPAGGEVPRGEIGELTLRGPSVMLGYLDQPKHPALRDGELFTSDLVTQDVDDYLYFHGRKDDVVKCAGERVSLDEVGEVLRRQPGVTAAQVVARKDPLTEHRLVAFVVGVTEERVLRSSLRAVLGPAKTPQKFVKLTALPTLANGKVDVMTLQSLAAKDTST